MNKALKKLPVLMGMFMFMLLLAPAPYPALGAEGLSRAPSNPAFLEHLRKKADRLAEEVAGVQSVSPTGPFFGYIPSPVDRTHLRGQSLPGPQLLSYLPYFDLRDSGNLTPVRDQGSCGTCWAFAGYGALESRLLFAADESWDFSENNLKNLAGFVPGPCDGGSLEMVAAYLSRWDGPVSESDDPYNVASGYSLPNLPERKHLQEALWFPPKTAPLTNDAIKEALTTYGGVYVGMLWTDSSFNPAYNTYYGISPTYDPYFPPNHAVVLVGWDDSFDNTKFSPAAPGNGAFIARNSWGSSWGESGYFYISYYDTTVGYYDVAVLSDVQPTSNFNRVFQHDPLGLTNFSGYPTSSTPTTAWFANAFTAAGKEDLSAVGFYTPTLNAAYQIKVYVGVGSSPTSGTLLSTATGTLAYPGYHTVPLDVSSGFKQGQRFAVVVKLTTPGYNFPIPVETPIDQYARPTAGLRQSYVSSNGTSWQDITLLESHTNVCLKAFTNPDPPPSGSITIKGGDVYTNTATVPVATSFSADTTQMQFSTNGATWTTWESVKPSRNLTLPAGNGVRTVTVRFKDGPGNIVAASDSIILDTKPPTGGVSIEGGAASTGSATVTLTLAAADINGVKEMQFSEDGTTWSSPADSYAATKTYNFSSAAPGTKKVYARFIDNAGKASAACSDTIVLTDTPPPTGDTGAVTIKNGTAYTTVATVPLTITNPGSWTSMQLSSNGTTGWTAWESVKNRSFALPAGDGIKTVYLRFKDGVGNVSGLYADTIILDTKLPTGGVTINGGAASTGSATVTLTLAAADINGVKEMQFSENGTTWPTAAEAYAATKIYTFSSAAPGIKKVYVRFIDNAEKKSLAASDTITLAAP